MKISTKLAAALAGTSVLALAGLVAARRRTRVTQARNPARGRFVQVDGVWLHVLQQGSGPDILLIHGAAMLADEIMLALGDAFPGHRITAIDRPGHGHSDTRRRPSITKQAELLHAAAVELDLQSPTVVGHSLGGAVALAYGEQFAGEVSGVVAVAPLAYPGWGVAHLGRAARGAPLVGPLLSNTTLGLTDPVLMRGAVRLIFSPQKPTSAFQDAIDVDLLARPASMVADGADLTRASIDLERLSPPIRRLPRAAARRGGREGPHPHAAASGRTSGQGLAPGPPDPASGPGPHAPPLCSRSRRRRRHRGPRPRRPHTPRHPRQRRVM
jgi:pimeloyl-ACP methyl ester carboxylesterase